MVCHMIDPATGWFEVKELKTKESWNIANIVEQTWLTQYSWPTILNYDQGTEFMAEFARMITEVTMKSINSQKYPQTNVLLTRRLLYHKKKIYST